MSELEPQSSGDADVPYVEPDLLDMRRVKVDPAWALRIPPTLAIRRQVLPFACVDDVVFVACADIDDRAAIDAVARFVRRSVRLERADPETLRPLIQRIFGGMSTTR